MSRLPLGARLFTIHEDGRCLLANRGQYIVSVGRSNGFGPVARHMVDDQGVITTVNEGNLPDSSGIETSTAVALNTEGTHIYCTGGENNSNVGIFTFTGDNKPLKLERPVFTGTKDIHALALNNDSSLW